MSIYGKKARVSAKALQAQFDRGIGSGEGSNYRPFHTSENTITPSHSGKWLCPLTQRYRHDLSELEEGIVYGCLRDPHVTDIRENFRLGIGLTRKICDQLKLKHPDSRGDGKPLIPYTTDILVTRDEPPIYIAFSGKTRNTLRKPADWRALLVEHVYWTLHDVPFLVATEFEISNNALKSLTFIRPDEVNFPRRADEEDLESDFLRLATAADWAQPLLTVVRKLSADMRLDNTKGMVLFKRLVWRGAMDCDLERRIDERTRNAVTF